MNIQSPNSELPYRLEQRVTAGQHALRLWWRALAPAQRALVWPAILAALVIFGQLLAFHHVVNGALQQGELRLKANASHKEATLRCNSLHGAQASESCLSDLKALAADNTLLRAQYRPGINESNVQVVAVTRLD
jgi:hypothetical protein